MYAKYVQCNIRVHSEKFPIHAMHRLAPIDTAVDWLSAMQFIKLFTKALDSNIS